MSFSTRIELHCDKTGCTHKPLVAEGPDAKRFGLYEQAKKSGWQWKSAEEVYCPDHREAPVRSAKEAKGKAKGKAAGKAAPKGKAKAGKGKIAAIVGASTGKLAKSAKASA